MERGGNVSAHVMKKDRLKTKHPSALVRRNIDVRNSVLFTDEYYGYIGIKNVHAASDHLSSAHFAEAECKS
jgi:hypothetical protein